MGPIDRLLAWVDRRARRRERRSRMLHGQRPGVDPLFWGLALLLSLAIWAAVLWLA